MPGDSPRRARARVVGVWIVFTAIKNFLILQERDINEHDHGRRHSPQLRERRVGERHRAHGASERHRVGAPAAARAARERGAVGPAAGAPLSERQRRRARHGAPVRAAGGLGHRGAARLQDPAHARAAAARHAQVELDRGLGHVGGRGQDAHRHQPGAGAVAGREHLRVPGRSRSAAAADRQLPRHELREGPVRLPARQGRARRRGLQAALGAPRRDPERARLPAFLGVPEQPAHVANSCRRWSAKCRAAS